jgi:hypothetical protein
MTFCLRQNLIQKVIAIREQQVPPREESVDQMNARVFAQHQRGVPVAVGQKTTLRQKIVLSAAHRSCFSP